MRYPTFWFLILFLVWIHIVRLIKDNIWGSGYDSTQANGALAIVWFNGEIHQLVNPSDLEGRERQEEYPSEECVPETQNWNQPIDVITLLSI